MKQLEAGELPLGKVFCSDYDFVIPEYQRPYAWGTEQALQLLDDLEDSLTRDADEPYFLGSVVLVKEKGVPRAEVIDGQQRLATLTILFAVLRDLTNNDQLAGELRDFIQEPGKILAGTKPKARLNLRNRDEDFFRDFVQTPDSMANLISLDDNFLENDAQHAVRNNADVLNDRLKGWSEDRRQELATMIGSRTFLVIVSTPDLTSAHRIFSVMNSRGLDLSPADIFKSMVIGATPEFDKGPYADKWEDAEQDLGRESFADLFAHIRMIFSKERARRELLREFQEQVLNNFLPERAKEFVDDVLLPYADHYGHLLNQDYTGKSWDHVNMWLRRLNQLDNNDWRPPALWALRRHSGEPLLLDSFLQRLERLAASMLIRRVYATPRSTRYADLLKEMENGAGAAATALDLSPSERSDTLDRLNGELYLVAPVRKYVLLRLDEALANGPGVAYKHRLITVEHVLPQHPTANSSWLATFSADEQAFWTHRLANLVLLNRAKNSEAQNYEFDAKKSKYFTSKVGVSTFALTVQVLNTSDWTPAILEVRQAALTKTLADEWSLHDGVEWDNSATGTSAAHF